MNITQRAITGSLYSIAASFVTIALGFIRAFLLTRFLLPADAGVFVQALFYLGLSGLLRLPGLDYALIHREEVNDQTLATYFTLRMGLTLLSLLLMAALVPLIGRFHADMPLIGPILLALLLLDLFKSFNTVQESILGRRLAFRRIAFADVLSGIAMTIVAPYLAWRGWGAWALVMERVTAQSVRMVVIWLYHRPWQPRLAWDGSLTRWFLSFSSKTWVESTISFVLDRFDDFWTGTFLGQEALGFYGRAYEFAQYPRKVVASPILSVFFPTFARLQQDRLHLSQAFFRVASLLVRVGFWFSLLFILTAPQFIPILGQQWLPMQTTFQLMIVYVLFDPLETVAANLLIAIGQPAITARARLIQLTFFLPTLFLFGSWWGINGVALAADFMVGCGVLFLFYHARRFVDFSPGRLLFWPFLALLLTLTIVLLLNPLWGQLSLWLALFTKAGLITILFGAVLLLTEREQLAQLWQFIRQATLRPAVKATVPDNKIDREW